MSFCPKSNQDHYPFKLPELPYSKDSFMPHFTPETFDYHYDKHHNAYVTNLNNLLQNRTQYHNLDLETIVKNSEVKTDIAIFNNAAQIWNHSFFWNSITPPKGHSQPLPKTLEYIKTSFDSYDNFKMQLKHAAVSQFGSGWAWLILNNNKLEITQTANAHTPIIKNLQPLVAIDVWEHAYYIDYRNKRPDYADIIITHLINWPRVEEMIIKNLENNI